MAAVEHTRTVTTKGQVTIPADVRRLLGIKAQDRVTFRIENGHVELQPATKIMTLEATFGSITPRKRPEDFKELRDIAIEEHVQRTIEKMQRENDEDTSKDQIENAI